MSKFEIRKLERSDSEGLSELYAAVYGVNFTGEYWEWKYFKNPYKDHMMYVAVNGDKLIGELGSVPVKIKYEDSSCLGCQTCDITIRPEFQKGGPFMKLYKLSYDDNYARGTVMSYGFSVPLTLKISTRLLKFRSLCHVWRCVLVLNPAPFVARKIGLPLLARVAGPLGKIYTKLSLRKHLKRVYDNVTEIARFDERFNRFWEERKGDHNIMVQRDSVYLNWRYAEHPTNQYKIFMCSDGDFVKGFVVLTIEQAEIKRGFIMELLVEPGNGEAFDSLLSAVVEYFLKENVDVITAWLPEMNPLVGEFERWRFVKLETQHDLIIKILKTEDEIDHKFIMDPANWFFSMGDSDYH